MRILVMILSIALLSGCATVTWHKKGVSEQQKKKDLYVCEKDMRQSGYYGSGLAAAIAAGEFFERCMNAEGYEKIVTQPQPQNKK